MNHFWDGFEAHRVVDRPALREALDRSAERRLTLIVAQAGAGKTTLLRQWRASHPEMVFALLDIDQSDNDPGYFVRHLLSAVAAESAALPQKYLVPSGFGDGDGLGADQISTITTVLELLPRVVIVLDNLHRLSNSRLVADLGRLLQQTPRNVRFVVSTRADPPLSLSQHRLTDDLLELRRGDLAFTVEETTVLLERLVGSPLPTEQVRVLWERTEGWAAGLQLAGLSLRQHNDPASFVADFGGSDRLVADYLGDEVLASLSTERRRMLLQLSALDEMSAGLVEATTGIHNAQAVLRTLQSESMFIVPLDSRGEWFRFHHLFRELLRSRLREESPAEELRMITAAADWNLTKGRVKHAMSYLLRAQARDGALEALLALTTDTPPPSGTVAAADRPVADDRTLSTSIQAELLTGVRQVLADDSASDLSPSAQLPAEETRWWDDASRPGLGYVAAQVLWRARPGDSPESARRRLYEIEDRCERRAVNGLTRKDAAELADALVCGGRAHFLAGDLPEARRWLTHALVAAGSDIVERIAACSALSLVEAWTGNVQEANLLVTETLTMARNAGMLALPSIADATLASVLTALEENETSERTPAQSGYAQHPDHTANAEHPDPPSTPTTRLSTALVALTSTVLFDRAVASLRADDPYAARNIVDNWSQLVPSSDPLSVVQYHILRAWLADHHHADDELRRQLTEAVRVAEIHGLVDVFVRAGPQILANLPSVASPQASFSAVITTRARLSEDPNEMWTLREPLTDREFEILSYLPTRFSNVDLAQRFFVSVNTIKTHIAHIYRKLDVADRDAAIRRARELGML